MKERIARWLARARSPWIAMAVAIVLALPSLQVGFQLDDYVHRVLVRHRDLPYLPSPSRFELFTLNRDGPHVIQRCIEEAMVPWWTAPDMRLAFWRPISSLSHILDYTLFPDDPVPMHVQNILLIGAIAAMAAALYGRLFATPAAAGLAALLYAADHGHVMSASWISSRNTLLAALMALVTLWAHLRWRVDGARPWPALLGFMLTMFCGESGIAVLAYIAGHALLVERRPRSLVPYLVLLAGWAAAYKAQGFGTSGSAMYVDPVREPAAYLAAAAVRVPILLLGQLALPPAQISVFYPQTWLLSAAVGAAAFLCWLAVFSWPVLRRDPVCAFMALGMLLAVAPIAATLPSERLLLLTGFGAMGLLARLAVSVFREGGRPGAVVIGALLFIRLPLSAVIALGSVSGYEVLDRVVQGGYGRVLKSEAESGRRALLLNAPSALLSGYLGSINFARGGRSIDWYHLSSATSPLEVFRANERTLILKPEAGFLPWPGTGLGKDLLDFRVLMQHMDVLYRSPSVKMAPGHIVRLKGLQVEVLKVDTRGQPTEAAFRFDVPLEDSSLSWYAWDELRLEPFALPKLGERVTVKPLAVEL